MARHKLMIEDFEGFQIHHEIAASYGHGNSKTLSAVITIGNPNVVHFIVNNISKEQGTRYDNLADAIFIYNII